MLAEVTGLLSSDGCSFSGTWCGNSKLWLQRGACAHGRCAQLSACLLTSCPSSCSWLPPRPSTRRRHWRRAGSGRPASSAWPASRCGLYASCCAACVGTLIMGAFTALPALQAASTGAAIDDLYRLPSASQPAAGQPQPQPQPQPQARAGTAQQPSSTGSPAGEPDKQGSSGGSTPAAAEAPAPVPATAGEAAAVARAAAVETSARFGSAALAWLRQRLRCASGARSPCALSGRRSHESYSGCMFCMLAVCCPGCACSTITFSALPATPPTRQAHRPRILPVLHPLRGGVPGRLLLAGPGPAAVALLLRPGVAPPQPAVLASHAHLHRAAGGGAGGWEGGWGLGQAGV